MEVVTLLPTFAVVVTVGVAYGSLRSLVGTIRESLAEIKAGLAEVQRTGRDNSDRLAKIEARIDSIEDLRFDDRLRSIELWAAQWRRPSDGSA